MAKSDLILLHAPSVYDFRKETILFGPVSDLIPATPVFELYPIGLTSIAEYLERAGFRVRIVNLAVRMMNRRGFDAEKMIKRLKAQVFGIDLHWMVHSHGAIEVAKLVKKHHPQSKVVFGGLSATYYYRQLIERPEIDFVLRGDSTEEPFRQLMDCLDKGKSPDEVPNLVWRDEQGAVRENAFSHVPADLNNVLVDYYPNMIRSVFRYRDLASVIPFKGWLRYPITAVLTCRGCTQNCIICGGSGATFRNFYNRKEPVFRSPKAVVRDVKQIERFSKGPVFILGDLDQSGDAYAYDLINRLGEAGVKNQIILELFNPAPTDLLKRMGEVCPNFCLEMSPESHDPEIRKILGRNYSDADFERTIADALAAGAGRLDIFYMTGLPQQTPQSVMDTVDYCGYLMEKFKGDKRLFLFIAPISPFLDPGSIAFEHPEQFGYRVLFRSLEEYRRALLSPSWKYSLNYETDWMTRDQIAETAYESILRLNRLKLKHGVIDRKTAEIGEQRLIAGREMMHRIDDLTAKGTLEDELPNLKAEIDRINVLTVSEKLELELPVGLINLKFWRSLWMGLSR